jgi:hypothetical protein
MAEIRRVYLGVQPYLVFNGKFYSESPVGIDIPYHPPITLHKILKELSKRMANTSVQELYDFINLKAKSSYSPTFKLKSSNDFLPIARILKKHHSEHLIIFLNSFFSRTSPKDYDPNLSTYSKAITSDRNHLYHEDIEKGLQIMEILLPLPKDFKRGGLTQ